MCRITQPATNSIFKLQSHILRLTFVWLHILGSVLKEPEKQSDLVAGKHPDTAGGLLLALSSCIFCSVCQKLPFGIKHKVANKHPSRTWSKWKSRLNPSVFPVLSLAVAVKTLREEMTCHSFSAPTRRGSFTRIALLHFHGICFKPAERELFSFSTTSDVHKPLLAW